MLSVYQSMRTIYSQRSRPHFLFYRLQAPLLFTRNMHRQLDAFHVLKIVISLKYFFFTNTPSFNSVIGLWGCQPQVSAVPYVVNDEEMSPCCCGGRNTQKENSNCWTLFFTLVTNYTSQKPVICLRFDWYYTGWVINEGKKYFSFCF